ncbi:tagatose-6-phosphate ketose/aldose isomerase [Nakamurella sp. UYEF19]|uniref:SIS domain-containing protein n=1 Tax=Nakamurella sp. UYEF19 TaxID=1756392 RepID=UPI00339ADCA4
MTATGQPSGDVDPSGAGWTAREIGQQPALWREVARSVESARAETDAFLAPLLAQTRLRIVLTGAGTSAFAGAVLAPYLARRMGRRVEAIATTDLVSNPREHLAEDVPTLLVSFARSGDSPESVAAARLASRCLTRCHHMVLTCNNRGELYRDHVAAPLSLVRVMPAGANDRGFAMTSSYTCMLLTALLVLGGESVDLVERLGAAADQLLAGTAAAIRDVAYRGPRKIVYLGSGPLTGLAQESALKMLELTAGTVATWFDSPLGFRHGPKSVLDDTTLVLVFVSNDPYTRKYDLDMVAELRATQQRGSVVVVSAAREDPEPDNCWMIDGVEDLDDVALSLPFVVCAQLLALHTSLARGFTPDNPFPGGEVNRVVRGVTIHELDGSG